jgi:hypothetical protein
MKHTFKIGDIFLDKNISGKIGTIIHIDTPSGFSTPITYYRVMWSLNYNWTYTEKDLLGMMKNKNDYSYFPVVE